MNVSLRLSVSASALILAAASAVDARVASKCAADAAKVGDVCVDRYEASVWQVPTTNRALIKRVEKGVAAAADLVAGGAIQLGCTAPPFAHTAFPAHFPADGSWTPVFGTDPATPGVYAVSIPGVLPTTCVTQLQAAQACALAGKHLIRNDEWQRAAAGTPDPPEGDDLATTCATQSPGPVRTAERVACRSSWGTFDQSGNVLEWVAEWTDRATGLGLHWPSDGIGNSDYSLFGGNGETAAAQLPGAPLRGGNWHNSFGAGIFRITADQLPGYAADDTGFRCAR